MMEPFEYSGIWWLPKQPDRQVSGVLKYDPNDRIVLDLIGSFKETRDLGRFGSEDIILGVTSSGKVITLYKCVDWGFQLTTPGFMSSKYLVRIVFVGHHFPDEQSLMFTSLSVEYEHLSEWARITGFNYKIENNNEGGLLQETISYSFPKEVSVSTDKLKFSFHHRYTSSGDRIQDINLRQTTYWNIEPEQELHYEVYHEQICYHIQNFLTLAVSRPVRPRTILGKAETSKETIAGGRTHYPDIEILYRIGQTTMEKSLRHPHEMLFLFGDINEHFQTCLSNWFSKATRLDSVYDLYFGTMYNDSMYLQQQFITLAQAIESYHRRVRTGEYIDPAGFAPIYGRLVGAIPEGIDKDFRASIVSKLHYLPEYSLRKRLNDLLADTADLLPYANVNSGQVVEDIVNTRNYLTHYDYSLAPKAKQGQELYDLVQLIRTLIQILLMLELGLPRELVAFLVERHARFR